MNSKFKGLAVGVAVSSVMAVSAAHSAPVLSVSGQGEAAALAAEAAYKAFLQPGSMITESFESYSSGVQSVSLSTSVGVFTQTVAGGISGGQCDAGFYACDSGLGVLDNATTPFTGRFAAPSGADNNKWLDSFDSEEVTFSIAAGFNAVGFFITDPNDVSGRMSVGGVDFSFADIFGSSGADGDVFYVTLFDQSGLGDIVLYANSNNDGYGIDNVTIGKVPEPATVALLGLGLLGISLVRRRQD